MKKIKFLIVALFAMMSVAGANAQALSANTKWHWAGNTIVTESPERPAGQKDVIGMACPKIEVVRIAFVGLGMRGPSAV